MISKNRVLVLDIETALMEAYVFKKGDQYISHSQIKQDWFVLSWSAKWLGDPSSRLIYRDQRHAKVLIDDSKSLFELSEILNKADYVMTQNGKKFDLPKLIARFMLNGIKPVRFLKHIDLYRELKGVGFTSHSLDYLTAKFCTKYKKLPHKKFPGMSLWIECSKGNPEAWAEMKKYNNHDVLSTEELYEKTKRWLPKVTYELEHPIPVCTKCGGRSFIKEGFRRCKNETYNRRYCKACGQLYKPEVSK